MTIFEFGGPVVLRAAATVLVKLEECADRCQARHRGRLARGPVSVGTGVGNLARFEGGLGLARRSANSSCVWRKKTMVGVLPKSMANC